MFEKLPYEYFTKIAILHQIHDPAIIKQRYESIKMPERISDNKYLLFSPFDISLEKNATCILNTGIRMSDSYYQNTTHRLGIPSIQIAKELSEIGCKRTQIIELMDYLEIAKGEILETIMATEPVSISKDQPIILLNLEPFASHTRDLLQELNDKIDAARKAKLRTKI